MWGPLFVGRATLVLEAVAKLGEGAHVEKVGQLFEVNGKVRGEGHVVLHHHDMRMREIHEQCLQGEPSVVKSGAISVDNRQLEKTW